MKPQAYIQADARLDKACRALERFAAAANPIEMASHWGDFLIALGGIYTKLEQGAKGNGPCNGWFGKKKHERRTDPLLSYLQQARNAEEHGLGDVTQIAGSGVSIPPGAMALLHTDGHSFTATNIIGEVTVPRDRVKLCPVYDDRSAKWFAVPTVHLGKPVENNSPGVVGSLGLAYLDALLKETKSLWLPDPVPSP